MQVSKRQCATTPIDAIASYYVVRVMEITKWKKLKKIEYTKRLNHTKTDKNASMSNKYAFS